jgi:LmbE family N-acetylglucosaminyl deacetylase
VRRLVLSPHLDDGVLSLGGSIHHWSQLGDDVTVLTVFAGDDPHARLRAADDLTARQLSLWGLDHYGRRREEDRAALALVRARPVHAHLPERLLRRLGGGTIAEMFDEPESDEVCAELRTAIQEAVAGSVADADAVYVPAGTAHPDHRLVADAVAALRPDAIPYEELPEGLDDETPVLRSEFCGRSLAAKIRAVSCYRSQLVVLFGSPDRAVRRLTRRAERLGSSGAYAEGLHVVTAAPAGGPR